MTSKKKRFSSADEMGRAIDEEEVTDESSTRVAVVVEKRYDPTLTMRIPEGELAKLKKLADARGVAVATLARMFLIERLAEESSPRPQTARIIHELIDDKTLRTALRQVLKGGSDKKLADARRLASESRRRAARARCGTRFEESTEPVNEDTKGTLRA